MLEVELFGFGGGVESDVGIRSRSDVVALVLEVKLSGCWRWSWV